MGFFPVPKDIIYVDLKYLAYIRHDHTCRLCGDAGNPHHVTIDKNAKGVAQKTHDYDTINLCPYHHAEHNEIGQHTFWGLNMVVPELEIALQMVKYVALNNKMALFMETVKAEDQNRENLMKFIKENI